TLTSPETKTETTSSVSDVVKTESAEAEPMGIGSVEDEKNGIDAETDEDEGNAGPTEKPDTTESGRVVVTDPVQTGPASGFTLLESVSFRLLFFFILIVQLSDSLQYAWSLLPGRHPIASQISQGKTIEGLIGSVVCAALIGTVLCWATPWPFWYTSLVSAGVALIGQLGSLAMSAVKRDRGVRDYGTLVAGHDGVLDRIDSLCFSAPFFYFMSLVWIHFRQM
ncbi:MAG: phosphatidate cytidylyltransferase, partial [Planctomycetia bacterium]|nr:phosphatidate cytidylyltransferase [Planctomycetia bacterium]